MPDTGHVSVPYASRLEVFRGYQEYVRARLEAGDDIGVTKPVSTSYFYKIWTAAAKARKIRLYANTSFTRCTICNNLTQKIKGTKDSAQRAVFREEMKQHREWAKREKEAYYATRERAINFPQTQVSLIVDGADQSKFHLPHFAINDHASCGRKLPVTIMGGLDHGRRAFVYPSCTNLRQGSNVTIEVIFRMLMHRLEFQPSPITHLSVQLDNTVKQCKSKYLLGFLGLLVLRNPTIEEITLSFLPVGHTHEDIDQLFSKIAHRLVGRDAPSLGALMDQIVKSFKRWDERPHVEEMTNICNFSDYVKPFLAVPGGITKWHQFRLTKGTEGPAAGNVLVVVREDMSSGFQWKGMGRGGPTLLFNGRGVEAFNAERLFLNMPDAQVRTESFTDPSKAQWLRE